MYNTMDKFKQFINELWDGNITKHQLKDFINSNGFFSKAMMNMISREEATDLLTSDWWDNTVQITNNIPEWDSIYIYEGIISQQYWKGERNRNGYKIDKNGWLLDEYKLNPAILLMHDPEKWVIWNMVKVWVVKQWLKWLFWVDVNNISDEWIKNQIRTGTLRATSTWSLIAEYMLEDVVSGKNYTEDKAIEIYGEWEVIKAYMWMESQVILNVTKSIMIETSPVSIWSNYKAVDGNTLSTYFNNLINNKMTTEQIKNAELNSENNGGTPEGAEEVVSENDTQVEATEDVIETPEVVEEEAPVAEEVVEIVVEDVVEDEPTEPTLEDKLAEKENEITRLTNELNEIKNTPVINTSLSKSVIEESRPSAQQIEKDFLSKTWSK